MDVEITEKDIRENYGEDSDPMDTWDDIHDFDSQLYSVLRATTEGLAFDVIENIATGAGLEAWRALHRRFDPATGSRKRIMLQALTSPERASYDNLQGALERWKALRSRYDKKRDQLGNREPLPESLAMNALEKLVPKELETHLLLNYARLRTFDDMEKEVINYVEARTGNRLTLSSNFSKASGGSSSGAMPMDVDSLVKVVSGSISSLAKGKGGGGKPSNHNKMNSSKFEGVCDNCGKYGHKKKDCWSKGQSGGSGKGTSNSKGGQDSGKGKKFTGKCDNCGKIGHKKADCWSGKGGGKGKKGDKSKQGNSLEKEQPQPEPAAASGLDLCSIELNALTRVRFKEHSDRGRSLAPSRAGTESSRYTREPVEELPEDMIIVKTEEGEEEAKSRSPSMAASVIVDDNGWVKCNLDSGAAVTVFPRCLDDELTPDDMQLKTASGEVIQGYGPAVLQGTDIRGQRRNLNGYVADVHKVLVSASKMHEKGYSTWLGQGGGIILSVNDPVYQAMDRAFQEAKRRYGVRSAIPVYQEDGVYNFYLKDYEMEQRSESPHTPPGPPSPARTQESQTPSRNSSEKRSANPITAATAASTRTPTVTYQTKQVPRARTRTPRDAGALEINAEDEMRPLEDEVRITEDERVAPEETGARPSNPGWTPDEPTEDERKEHEASGHAVYRSWCQECIAATGYGQQHRRVDHREDRINTVSMDYFYLKDEAGARPHLVAQDRKNGMMFATSLQEKGDRETTGRKLLSRFLELLGDKEMVLKSDGEHALVKMKKAAGKEAKTLTKVVCEESPADDPKANGEAEVAVKEVKWRIRAITMMVEKRLGKLPEGHPLLLWIPRYAAEQANRHRLGHDGKTPEERRTGKRWLKPTPIYGERIMIKPAGKGKKDDASRMKPARFIGCHNRFGSVLGMTEEGVIVGSSYHSLPESEKWGPLEANLKGAPWDVRAYVRRQPEEIPQPVVQAQQPQVVVVQPSPDAGGDQRALQDRGEAGGPGGEAAEFQGERIGEPSASTQAKPGSTKAWPVRREHLSKFGRTAECPGCTSILKGAGFQQVAHSDGCRQRIKRCMLEEIERKEEQVKKQRIEEEGLIPGEEPAGSGNAEGQASSSSGIQRTEARDSLQEDQGTKRKAGEDENITDIDDLVRQMEDEMTRGGGTKEASINAMAEVMNSYEAAKILADIAAMDVIEVFSPQRVNLEVERFGLRKGAAIDLEELKPDGTEHWDLDQEGDFLEAMDLIALEQPWLVTSSPPCTTFSPLRRITNKKRSKEMVRHEEEVGRLRLTRALECCKLQASMGGYFLHEHPKGSSSWKLPEVQELVEREGMYLVQSPMCRFGMKMKDMNGNMRHVRKETLWLTNSKQIAEELQGTCENELRGRIVHRHVHLVGGSRAKAAQVYPRELVEAILRGLKRELRTSFNLSAVEEAVGGPVPDDAGEFEDLMEEFYDEASGAKLDPKLVKQSRKEELDWIHKEQVYVRVPASEVTGPLLQLKWLDLNKGDNECPKMRSRLVAKEIKRSKPLHEQLGGPDTFSATPPIESVYSLMSTFVTKRAGNPRLRLASWDISRAHFMGKAARTIFVQLPNEDLVREEDEGQPMAGKLLKSMYGTQDASRIFQCDYTELITKEGGEFSALCPAIFKIDKWEVIGLVHGDDFLVVGADESLREVDKMLNSRYTARWESLLGGEDEKDQKEMYFLNRLVRYVPDGADADGARLEVEADARHVEILMRDFGFNSKTKGCDTPEDKITPGELMETERQPVLGKYESSLYRSMVMRMAYLSVDRPDLCHTVRVLAGAMQAPKMNDMLRLKRAVRYLVKYPYMKRVFKEQHQKDLQVVALSDSDWAGDLRSRRSTSGSVVKVGQHTVLVKGASQKVVALSSAESEYYAMCRTAVLAEFIRGILLFWFGGERKTRMKVDSSSAKSMAERKGVGQSRHIQAMYLWLQEKVAAKELEIDKIKGEVNDSDLTTKVQPKGTIQKHLERLGFSTTGREGHKRLT